MVLSSALIVLLTFSDALKDDNGDKRAGLTSGNPYTSVSGLRLCVCSGVAACIEKLFEKSSRHKKTLLIQARTGFFAVIMTEL